MTSHSSNPPILTQSPELAALTEAIRDRLSDCSTVDFYDISEGGVSNLAMLAAQAVASLLSPNVPASPCPDAARYDRGECCGGDCFDVPASGVGDDIVVPRSFLKELQDCLDSIDIYGEEQPKAERCYELITAALAYAPDAPASGGGGGGSEGWCFDMEKAPKDGTWVLGLQDIYSHPHMKPANVVRWHQGHWTAWAFEDIKDPIAWRPLPSPPLSPVQTVGKEQQQGASSSKTGLSPKGEATVVSSSLRDFDPSRMNLEQYAHALQIALTGLAGGGSENFVRCGDGYRADIARCVTKVREREQRSHARYLEVRSALNEACGHEQ